ncbi:MAG: hypothetical protein BWY09_01022 [Candidatus Hydrogenedentes bacterium ADurb.Bin179]|nr:MAG: hypothetical protein BWY09_01022 [Candidatus Hydrogenedentes bacterium ADurb.Bin179]
MKRFVFLYVMWTMTGFWISFPVTKMLPAVYIEIRGGRNGDTAFYVQRKRPRLSRKWAPWILPIRMSFMPLWGHIEGREKQDVGRLIFL